MTWVKFSGIGLGPSCIQIVGAIAAAAEGVAAWLGLGLGLGLRLGFGCGATPLHG